jgi:hypothetical protein
LYVSSIGAANVSLDARMSAKACACRVISSVLQSSCAHAKPHSA